MALCGTAIRNQRTPYCAYAGVQFSIVASKRLSYRSSWPRVSSQKGTSSSTSRALAVRDQSASHNCLCPSFKKTFFSIVFFAKRMWQNECFVVIVVRRHHTHTHTHTHTPALRCARMHFFHATSNCRECPLTNFQLAPNHKIRDFGPAPCRSKSDHSAVHQVRSKPGLPVVRTQSLGSGSFTDLMQYA